MLEKALCRPRQEDHSKFETSLGNSNSGHKNGKEQSVTSKRLRTTGVTCRFLRVNITDFQAGPVAWIAILLSLVDIEREGAQWESCGDWRRGGWEKGAADIIHSRCFTSRSAACRIAPEFLNCSLTLNPCSFTHTLDLPVTSVSSSSKLFVSKFPSSHNLNPSHPLVLSSTSSLFPLTLTRPLNP